MSDPPTNIPDSTCGTVSQALIRLRGNLANGDYLRENVYTVDESRLAGNTHHYWIRLGLSSETGRILDEFIPRELPEPTANWLKSQLERKILRRLPREYSTLIKIPFSVSLADVAGERTSRTELAITQGLPKVTPYVIFHLEINRLLKAIGADCPVPTNSEVEALLSRSCRTTIAKARERYPETWDQQRGHYVLDSRGAHFAKELVTELVGRNLLFSSSRFVDIGSGIGTNVFAVSRYSCAQATGVELHPGLVRMSKVLMRRLVRLGLLERPRIDFRTGDAFDLRVIELKKFDVVYAYSPIGMWEIDIDQVVDRAKVGATIIFNRLPQRTLRFVEILDQIGGLFAFRKIVHPTPDSDCEQ